MNNFKNYKWRMLAFVLLLSSFVACNDDDDETAMNPTSDFSAEMNDLDVTFTSATQYAVSLAWDFGDGESSTAVNPTHTYAAVGDYSVTLKAIGAVGADSSMVTKTISVAQINPTASFTSEVDNRTITFTNTSERAVSFAWDFGDGETSTDENPVHTYADAGEYTVTLTTTGVDGSTPASVSQNVAAAVAVFVPVTVENGDFELPGTGRLKNWDDIPGWNSDVPSEDSGVENRADITEGGSYVGVIRNVDGPVWNLTDHVIVEGEQIKLTADMADIWDSPKFIVTIYYNTGDGVRQVLETQTFDVVASQANTIELTTTATAESVGARLGVELHNESSNVTNWGWLAVDNVKLFVK
ncbi:PKD domain-containing protein [Mangrovibacterium lignilyticum]|uniref:PKD domain-containing protein n=1 Tax=Mangrovibacterium lignilyticum TaxID=2668052 RepID=UPI0013D4CC0A|nr:PKD domain-containing protein [Mangrovibacterium lignilyticum]